MKKKLSKNGERSLRSLYRSHDDRNLFKHEWRAMSGLCSLGLATWTEGVLEMTPKGVRKAESLCRIPKRSRVGSVAAN